MWSLWKWTLKGGCVVKAGTERLERANHDWQSWQTIALCTNHDWRSWQTIALCTKIKIWHVMHAHRGLHTSSESKEGRCIMHDSLRNEVIWKNPWHITACPMDPGLGWKIQCADLWLSYGAGRVQGHVTQRLWQPTCLSMRIMSGILY